MTDVPFSVDTSETRPQSILELRQWCERQVDTIVDLPQDAIIGIPAEIWQETWRLAAHFGAADVAKEIAPPVEVFGYLAVFAVDRGFKRVVVHLARLIAWCGQAEGVSRIARQLPSYQIPSEPQKPVEGDFPLGPLEKSKCQQQASVNSGLLEASKVQPNRPEQREETALQRTDENTETLVQKYLDGKGPGEVTIRKLGEVIGRATGTIAETQAWKVYAARTREYKETRKEIKTRPLTDKMLASIPGKQEADEAIDPADLFWRKLIEMVDPKYRSDLHQLDESGRGNLIALIQKCGLDKREQDKREELVKLVVEGYFDRMVERTTFKRRG